VSLVFHAADKTQNSDHIHFWISSEDTIIYNQIAQEMVAMGYSNEEDIYIQKYEDNKKLDEMEYVYHEDSTLEDRFSIKPMGMEAGKTLDSINKMLSIDNKVEQEAEIVKHEYMDLKEDSEEIKHTPRVLSSLPEKYNSILDNINNLFKKVVSVTSKEKDIPIDDEATKNFNEHLESFTKKTSITKACTLPKTEETSSILSRIEALREQVNRN